MMGAAARKTGRTISEAEEEMALASSLRGNLDFSSNGRVRPPPSGASKARGVISDDSDSPPVVSSGNREKDSGQVESIPEHVIERDSTDTDDVLEEFDSDIDIDEDPTTQSISMLRRTGAAVNLQNQQLEREVEYLKQQLEELERLEKEAAYKSPVRANWNHSSTHTTPNEDRDVKRAVNHTPSSSTAQITRQASDSKNSPAKTRQPLIENAMRTPDKSPKPDIAAEGKRSTKKTSALRGLNTKRRHTYHHNSPKKENHTMSSASATNLEYSSPLRNLDLLHTIAEETKRSPTEAGNHRAFVNTQAQEVSDADVRAWSSNLSTKWAEVELLLRRPITCNEDIVYTLAASEAGLLFLEQLDRTAKSLQCLRGTISRWILPYDASTNVTDQSSMIRQVLDNTPECLQGKLSDRNISYLVAGANSVRKLVRVKIADDNDLEQARMALTTAVEFFQRLVKCADRVGVDPYSLLEENRQV